MAVTIEKRPLGVVLGSAVTATINSDYSSAFATVNKTAHGLSDGQYVYIKSNVENYNGFWKIDVTNANEFILIDNPYVAWIVDADITYYPQITTHGWSCVHLPIVYELSNTRYPINSVDSIRTVSSISSDFGNTNLNLSGSLGTFEDLSFVKISNAPNSDLNGVYQITDKIATNDVTINLNFASVTAAGIIGASVQLFYSNYNVIVRVYAGINSGHEWADQKPYELATTLVFIPVEDNRIKFSINEALKPYTKIENNLTLSTLPNNIDAWCNFYIEVAEQYSTSNGYTITTNTSGYAADTFEGYAVNSMLAFKNVHSGYLSDYIMVNSASKFLTLFAIPVIFACSDDTPDCYNEITFILQPNSLTVPPIVGAVATSYTNTTAEPGEAWNLATSKVTWVSNNANTEVMYVPFNGKAGVTYSFNIDAQISGTWTTVGGGLKLGLVGLKYDLTKSASNLIILGVSASTQSFTGITTYTPTEDITYIGLYLYADGVKSSGTAVGDVFSFSKVSDLKLREVFYSNNVLQTTEYIELDSDEEGVYRIPLEPSCSYDRVDITLLDSLEVISETKQFSIECGCANQEIRLMWLNNLGGFDQWKFTGQTEHTVDITDSGEVKQNIFPDWGKSYGEFADTIKKQTFRESANRKFVFSQFLTQDEADAISYIKSSPLVQIVNSRTDRRTVLVDTDSFTKYRDGDKTYTVQFNILYTDDIPSQRV